MPLGTLLLHKGRNTLVLLHTSGFFLNSFRDVLPYSQVWSTDNFITIFPVVSISYIMLLPRRQRRDQRRVSALRLNNRHSVDVLRNKSRTIRR